MSDWDPTLYAQFTGPRLRPALDLLRAVDASHRGDAEAAAGHLRRGMQRTDDPAYNVLADFEDFLPAPEIVESAPVQALYAELAERRAAALAELQAAYPEPLL